MISKYEVLLDTCDVALIKDGKCKDPDRKRIKENEKQTRYDLNQIHDLGFTLSPKPFNLLLRRRPLIENDTFHDCAEDN